MSDLGIKPFLSKERADEIDVATAVAMSAGADLTLSAAVDRLFQMAQSLFVDIDDEAVRHPVNRSVISIREMTLDRAALLVALSRLQPSRTIDKGDDE